jgi:hypothetical protein
LEFLQPQRECADSARQDDPRSLYFARSERRTNNERIDGVKGIRPGSQYRPKVLVAIEIAVADLATNKNHGFGWLGSLGKSGALQLKVSQARRS